MKQKTESIYRTSMVVLYMVLRFGWNLYSKYWESFAELSEDYTKDYGDQQLLLVNNAQSMPNNSQRLSSITLLGNELDESSATGILFWKKLRRYIIKAVDEKDRTAAILNAGGANFAKARAGNWAQITELLSAGQIYLESNADMLINKAKMPATFAAGYSKAKETYDKEHLDYGSGKGDAAAGTVDKVEANNVLYNNIQFMFGDAQVALYNQKSIVKQFSFAAVKRLVTKNMAGIHFTILESGVKEPKKPAITATITTDENSEVYDVNKRGVANILMKVGVHSITVACPGFLPYTGIVKVDAGIKHRVTIELVTDTVPVSPALTSEAAPAEVAFTGETQLEQ